MDYAKRLETLHVSAEKAITLLSGKPENWLAIATQFIQEKGYLYWENLTEGKVPGSYNIGNNKVEVNGQLEWAAPSDLEHGIETYCDCFTIDPAGYYTHVLEAIRTMDNDAVLESLHDSPYCAPPYPLQELRSILDHLEIVFGLQPGEVATKKESHSDSNSEYVTITKEPPFNTLWGIAQKEEGNGRLWVGYMRLNPGLNPIHLRVGDKVRIR